MERQTKSLSERQISVLNWKMLTGLVDQNTAIGKWKKREFESEKNERWSLRKVVLKKKTEMKSIEEMALGNLVMIEKKCGRSCVCRNKQKENQDLKTYHYRRKKKKLLSTKTLVFHKINRRGCS